MVGTPRQWKLSSDPTGTVSVGATFWLAVVSESLMLMVTGWVFGLPFTTRVTKPVPVAPAKESPWSLILKVGSSGKGALSWLGARSIIGRGGKLSTALKITRAGVGSALPWLSMA